MARVFMKGCEAMAEAAVRAGCRFFAGYPITPQNEIPEYMSRRLPEVGGHFVQGESEVASVSMVYGAAASGTRSMTSSSSPGISLKSEGVSYCASARVPMVYINVARGGPGVGSIQPAQMDYLQATKASGNGGFRMRVFAPATVQEAADMVYAAFDYADRDRNPVLILSDGVVGTMMEPVELPPMKTEEEVAAIKESKRSWAIVGHKLDYAHRAWIQPRGGVPARGRGDRADLLRHLRADRQKRGERAEARGREGGADPAAHGLSLPLRGLRPHRLSPRQGDIGCGDVDPGPVPGGC